jgi:prevent-host-death family protein
MKTVNIQAAKTHLSRLVDQAASGEEIVLAKAGKPLVRMVPYVSVKKPRTPGVFSGQGWETAECWAPDENVLDGSIEHPLVPGAVEEPPSAKNPGAS